MNLNNVDTIVLQTRKHQENDILLVCLTRSMGKIYLIATNANSMNSHLRPFCQIITQGMIMLSPVKGQDNLYYLQQAAIDNAFTNIKNHQLKLAIACYWLSLVSEVLLNGQQDQQVFELLSNALTVLNLLEQDAEINNFHAVIVVRILSAIGLPAIPPWCSICKSTLEKNQFIQASSGRVYCDNCRPSSAQLIAYNHLEQWRNLINNGLNTFRKWDVSPELIVAIEAYINGLLGRELKGAKYLKLIRGY